jgi:ATP-binding cassette subfamily B protein
MDCGPAVLKCALEGFGLPIHYGRLREACQTDVDGTSVDVLEDTACRLGLQAEQVMLPVNHVLLAEAEALPAIVIIRLPNGFTHFVLAWRRHGPLLQIMDPGVGRRWVSCKRFLQDIYVHTQAIPAKAWHEWAVTDDFRRLFARRLHDLGAGARGVSALETAAAATDWRPLAQLDAATRLAESLVQAGGLRRGREVANLLETLCKDGNGEAKSAGISIPEAYWSALPAPARGNGEELLRVRGAVLIRIRGRRPADPTSADPATALTPELAAARAQPASRPLQTLIRLLAGHGRLAFLVLAIGLLLAAGGGVLEAVLLRGLLDIGRDLRLVTQRLEAIGCILAFAGLLLFLDLRLATALIRLGRHLESRLRIAFLEKIPRLNDRYFQSRPTSDMAERSHGIHQIRLLPRLAGQFARATLTLLLTAAAIAWVNPASAGIAFLAAAVAIAVPVMFNRLLAEMELRVRTHSGALCRFYLDALLGLAPVRSHGANRALCREHESLLVEWVKASRRLLGWVVTVEGLQVLTGFSLAGWLLLMHAGQVSATGGALLLAYWALSLPILGEEIALLAQQYPMQRNIVLRLLEPLGALEGDGAAQSHAATTDCRIANKDYRTTENRRSNVEQVNGVAIVLERVTVRAAGQTILNEIDVHIPAGSHVGVVGVSGAGKSSLVGLLLGWHRAAAGHILVDGEPLDATRLDRLRGETAWLDPAIQLWNRTLYLNLLYGSTGESERTLGEVLQDADLYHVLQRLPDGLQTPLGDGGGLVSGGEGQRVRFGRALVRGGVRLAILDEPFRGLDREKRRELLQRARRAWRDATLLCVTHDVGETLDFERVLVIEGGRIVEDGPPQLLAGDAASRYRSLLDAENAVRKELWSSAVWRRLRLESGKLNIECRTRNIER